MRTILQNPKLIDRLSGRAVAQGEQSPRWETTRRGGVEMLERDHSHAKITRYDQVSGDQLHRQSLKKTSARIGDR
jgi:hypothetical protein